MRLNSPKIISPNFFGFAEHGNFESKDTITYLDVPDDDGPCYYFFNNFIVNTGHTITTKRPCRGLYIYCMQTAIINGTISMTNRGIYSPPEGEYENGYVPLGMANVIGTNFNIQIGIPGKGNLAATDTDGKNGGCGGGGTSPQTSAAITSVKHGGVAGGCAGVFGSGSGGGGTQFGGNLYGSWTQWWRGTVGTDYSGPGGRGVYNEYMGLGSAGVGNPTYFYQSTATDTLSVGWHLGNKSETASVLYFVCNSLVVSDSSLFESKGIKNTGTYRSESYRGTSSSPGGSSGGGSVTILYSHLIGKLNYNVAGGEHYNTTTRSGNGSFRSYQIL